MVEEGKAHEHARRPHYRLYRRREVWLSIILGSLILLCGIAIGSSVVILRFKEEMTPYEIHPERSPAIIAARMQRRLELSDEQTKKVQVLLQKRFKAVQAAHKDAGKKIDAEHKQLRAEMKKVLTDEQFKEWNSHFKRMQERAARRDEGDRRDRRRRRFEGDSPQEEHPPDNEHDSNRPRRRRRQGFEGIIPPPGDRRDYDAR